MSYTPPTAALDAALGAVRAIDGPASIGSADVVSAALTAAVPLIQAAALRDAADDLEDECAAFASECFCGGSDWLRTRANNLEGKTK